MRRGLGVCHKHDILCENGDEERKSKISKTAPIADIRVFSNAIGNASVSSAVSSDGNESASGERARAVVSSILSHVEPVSDNKINITINCVVPQK